MAGTNRKFSGCGFHHVALRASDFDKSLLFYTEGMGFPVLDLGDGNYLELFASTPEQNPPVEGRFFHLALRSTDVDADIEVVRALGCTITIEPKSVEVNGKTIRVGFFLGPDGEVLEFFHNDEL